MSGQSESNPVLWLAARVGKMAVSFPLWITRCVPQEKFSLQVYQSVLTKFVRSGWLDIGLVPFFLRVYGPRLVSVLKHAEKNLNGQYLVNNSLTIHQNHGHATVSVWVLADLNLHRFLRFYFSAFSLVLVLIEKIYQTLRTVFHRLSKHLDRSAKIPRYASYFQLSSRCFLYHLSTNFWLYILEGFAVVRLAD